MSEILESFREEVEASIKVALEMMGAEKIELAIETPPDEKMGDLAVPCFPLAKILKKSPQAIATEIAGAVERLLDPATRREYARKGRELTQTLSWDRTADVVAEALQKSFN